MWLALLIMAISTEHNAVWLLEIVEERHTQTTIAKRLWYSMMLIANRLHA